MDSKATPIDALREPDAPAHSRPPRRRLFAAGLFVVFVVAALLATQPLSTHVSTRLPSNADALVFSWTLKSICGGLASPSEAFRGNMFYPDTASLLYTEPLVGLAIQVAPLCALNLDHVTLFNSTLVVVLALSALGAWFLAREITGSGSAALVAAVVFSFTSANYDSAARIQVVASQWTPFFFLFLIRFCKQGKLKDAALMGGAFAMQALSCTYFEIFLAILLLLSSPFWIGLAGGTVALRQRATGTIAAALIAAVFVLPINLAQRFHLDPVMAARPQAQQVTLSFFTDVLPTNLIYGRFLGRDRVAYDALYFPGLVPLALSTLFLVGVFQHRKSERTLPPGLKPLLFLGGAAFLFAFGTEVATPWGDVPGPLALFSHVPGLGQARVPSRFLMFARLSLAVMAAAGARLALGQSPRVSRIRASALAFVCFIEHWSVPLDTWVTPTKNQLPKVYAWLATQPAQGPILEFPPALQRLRREEAAWLHTAAFHRIPMANGFSSFRPAWHEFVMEAALRWPDERLLTILDEVGVRTIVVHPRPRGLPEVDDAVQALLSFASEHPEKLRLVASFSDPEGLEGLWSRLGDEKVFAIQPVETLVPAPVPPAMDRSGWSCRSSEPNCERAIDGDPATLLLGRDASAGQFLRVLFTAPARVEAISISLGRFAESFPREPVIRIRQGAEWVSADAQLDVRKMLADMMRGSTNPIMIWRFPSTTASGFEVRLRPDARRFRAFGVPEVHAHGTAVATAPSSGLTAEPAPQTTPQ